MSPTAAVTIACVMFVVLGIVLVVTGRRTRLTAKASAAWPQVLGTVSDLRVVEQRRSKDATRYMPVVTYGYEVGGQHFTGTRLMFGDASRITAARAQETLSAYAVGGSVPVHYDPVNPGSATLNTDTRGTAVTEVLGFVMVAAGILVGLFIPLT